MGAAPKIIEFISAEDAAHGLKTERNLIAVVDIPNGNEVIRLVRDAKRAHVVQKSSTAFETEVEASKWMLLEPDAFFKNPIEVIFTLDGEAATEEHPSLHVVSSFDEKKSKVLSQFETFLEGLPGSRSIRETAQLIADELFTNGAKNGFDPPRLRDSKPVLAGTVEFFAKSDGKRLVFGCRDTYGTLQIEQVLSRIETCYQKGVANSIHQGDGGAGIGSFMVFTNSISYYAGVDPGKMTIVCVALPLGKRHGEWDELPKNIHLISR